jgi:hypothetical protein
MMSEKYKEEWFQEIIRETEHYYQAEIQQEQRASWIIASTFVIFAVFIGFYDDLSDTIIHYLFFISKIAFGLSGLLSIIGIIPLRKFGFKRDFFGGKYLREKQKDIHELINKKFHTDGDWDEEDYENRILFHFRSHYLRARKKEYLVFWSSLLLIVGFISLVIGIVVLQFDGSSPASIFQITIN